MYGLGEILSQGLPLVLDPFVIMLALIGSTLGLIVGALPGLSGVMAMAILIPLTYTLTPPQAFALLLPTYTAGAYGGSIGAILLNIPGTGAAIMTALDGHPMAQRGEAGRAIGITCTYSFIGGTVSAVFLAFFAPIIAHWALRLGSHEVAAVAIFGLGVISYISPSVVLGLISGAFGLLLATMGVDPINGYSRFVFGVPQLAGGLQFVPVMIGLFGLGEILISVDRGLTETRIPKTRISQVVPKLSVLVRTIPTAIRSLLSGLFIGIIPASGPTIASVVSYGLEKRVGKNRDQLGKGSPEGLVAAETANNAATGAAIVPMITLGIPGDAVTAILIGALLLHGLRPGPSLFIEHPDIVSSIFILFFLGNVFFFIIALLGARLFVYALRTPQRLLLPIVTVLCFVGSFSVRNNVFDVIVLIAFGLLGYFMRKVKLPPAPLILGFILGPIVEDNLRRALIISDGSLLGFFTRPISAVLVTLTVLLLVSPLLFKLLGAQRVGVSPGGER